MKILIRTAFLIFMTLFLTQCYTEVIEEITEIPYDTIEQKKSELRELQSQLNEQVVKSVDLQAQIESLITEINNLVPPPPPGALAISYSIGLVSAAREADRIGISGATVSMDIDGVRTTATTDSDGQALFENLRSGVVLVHVEVAGYTDVSFVADLMGSSDNVASTIALYPTTAANGAVLIDGTLWFDPDRTDDILLPGDPGYGIVNYNTTFGASQDYRPAPVINSTDGTFVSETQAFLDARIQSWEPINQSVNLFGFIQPNPADYQFIPPANPGNIILAIYEEMFISTASNATDGTFQLVMPARSNISGGGNNFRIHFAEFEGTETYVRSINTITAPPSTTTSTRDRTVIFTALYGELETTFALVGSRYPGTFIGPAYTFDQALVNNFNGVINTKGANSTLEADFYFGARTRDE